MLTKEELKSALQKCFMLGEVHWQQADSKNMKDWDKADETYAAYKAFVQETVDKFEKE
jgi:2-oxoglutarate dehydrogenase complex dehydrogenase (E1) component-like enzyme